MAESDVQISEDVARYSYAELYRMLTRHNDIIIFVRAIDLEKTKKGIYNAKTRESEKDADAGFNKTKERIDCQLLTKTKEENAKYPESIVKLQISLVERTNVDIFSIKTLSGDEVE